MSRSYTAYFVIEGTISFEVEDDQDAWDIAHDQVSNFTVEYLPNDHNVQISNEIFMDIISVEETEKE